MIRRIGIHGAGVIGISEAVNGALDGVPPVLINYFNQLYAGVRNNYGGWLGFKITVGASDITVLALGRSVSTAMNFNHTIGIWNGVGSLLLASVIVTPASPIDALGYKYEAVAYVLVAGTTYTIASSEASGGDSWMDSAAIPNHTAVATIDRGKYGPIAPSGAWGGVNTGYIVPTFYY